MRKLLFNIAKPVESKEDIEQTPIVVEEPVKRKRGRHKKVQKEVLQKPYKKEPENVPVTVSEETKKPQIQGSWTLLTKDTKPEIRKPCEFCVVIDGKEKEISYGYLDRCNVICSNNSYLFRLRSKYQNLMFRLLPCESIENCPEEFPNCKNCKKNKK